MTPEALDSRRTLCSSPARATRCGRRISEGATFPLAKANGRTHPFSGTGIPILEAVAQETSMQIEVEISHTREYRENSLAQMARRLASKVSFHVKTTQVQTGRTFEEDH